MEHLADNLDDFRRNYRAYVENALGVGRSELVAGRGVDYGNDRPPRDGALAFGAFYNIECYLQQKPRGRAFRPSPAFLLRGDPLTIRVPDVSFIEAHRCAQFDWNQLCPIAPDLIVEVLTDTSRAAEVDERIADFFAAGTRIAWILDGRSDTVVVRHARGESRRFHDNEKVLSAPVLPRLNLPVYELFGG
jgi:Uma2 family endonuclease